MSGEEYRAWVAKRVPIERDLIRNLGITFEGG
jgi:hypothetical protein